MTYNPEHDALIIREHARLREKIMTVVSTKNLGGRYYIARADVLSLLHRVEDNKIDVDTAKPLSRPRKYRG